MKCTDEEILTNCGNSTYVFEKKSSPTEYLEVRTVSAAHIQGRLIEGGRAQVESYKIFWCKMEISSEKKD